MASSSSEELPPFNPYVFQSLEHYEDWIEYCEVFRVKFWTVRPDTLYELIRTGKHSKSLLYKNRVIKRIEKTRK